MSEADLSLSQRAVLHAGTRLVEACPGAGKTRSIVSRFSSRSSSDGAVALVSFTNAAADEARRRCTGIPGILDAPNFVETFDKFIHRYIVTPYVVRTLGKSPHYLDKWDDIPAKWTVLRLDGLPGAGLRLSSFLQREDGQFEYTDCPPKEDKSYLKALSEIGYDATALIDEARAQIMWLLDSGVYDCDNARLQALRILRDGNHLWLRQRLSVRFREIILDESQDCSDIEYALIDEFNKMGIVTVVVADVDQSIYEFRRARPDNFERIKETLAASQMVILSESYRSSPAICSLVTSLRAFSTSTITSIPTDLNSPAPDVVYVVSGSPDYQQEVFRSLLSSHGIPTSKSMVLSPTRKQAARLAGRQYSSELGTGISGRILRLLVSLKHARNGQARKVYIGILTRLILGYFEWTQVELTTVESRLQYLGITVHDIQYIALLIMSDAASWTKREDVPKTVLSIVEERLGGLPLQLKALNRIIVKPIENDWQYWIDSQVAQSIDDPLPCSHVHSVKGLEYEAVMLDIPQTKSEGEEKLAVDSWRDGEGSESRRILYVGASRAQKLLVLAVPPRKLNDLRKILDRDGVPVKYFDQSASGRRLGRTSKLKPHQQPALFEALLQTDGVEAGQLLVDFGE